MDFDPAGPPVYEPPMVPAAQTAWAPGWYPVAPTALGWWDGYQWTGHYQQMPVQQTEEQAGAFAASFAWWGSLLVGFWPALIIFLTNNPTTPGTNRFARFSSGEALNVHLTVLCASVPIYGLFFVSFFSTFATSFDAEGSSSAFFPASFALLWVAAMVLGVGLTVVYVLAAVRAHKGVWWTARYAIPFLRAHRLLSPTGE